MSVKIDGNGPITGASLGPMGQCRLGKSGANLLLSPFQGSTVTINGVPYTIPAAGVSLAPTGAVASTNYLIYLLQTAGVLSMEYSTTAHATDTSTTNGNQGAEIKSGDATRTLVGRARTDAAGAWADTEAQRFVISWFNRRPVLTRNRYTANRTTTSVAPTFAEMNTEIRCEFLSWGEPTRGFLSSTVGGSVAGNYAMSVVALNGAAPDDGQQTYASTAGAFNSVQCATPINPVEGYNYITLLGWTTGGTATWQSAAPTLGQSTVLSATIQG